MEVGDEIGRLVVCIHRQHLDLSFVAVLIGQLVVF